MRLWTARQKTLGDIFVLNLYRAPSCSTPTTLYIISKNESLKRSFGLQRCNIRLSLVRSSLSRNTNWSMQHAGNVHAAATSGGQLQSHRTASADVMTCQQFSLRQRIQESEVAPDGNVRRQRDLVLVAHREAARLTCGQLQCNCRIPVIAGHYHLPTPHKLQ